jgi:hypothetical protein
VIGEYPISFAFLLQLLSIKLKKDWTDLFSIVLPLYAMP